jgi:ABC-2 type transport system ATP-binding protein
MREFVIDVKNLRKEFVFSVRNEKKGFFSNLLFPEKKHVVAVNDVTFSVRPGERLAFIGPNGAGKSTTIKMLTGILFPSDGEMDVLGLDPIGERKKLAYKIGTVFGQRSQLFPNLPFIESMFFFGVMYDMSKKEIKKRSIELTEIFDLAEFKDQPVRKLSLGQRMRAEIACALIHKPEIIFLDEPTIGLDVVAKKKLRELLLKLNQEYGTTIFLTSHDVGDIESLCERTIIINHGTIVKDLPTVELQKSFIHEKYIDVVLHEYVDSEVLPQLPEGINYSQINPGSHLKLSFVVDLKKVALQDALKKLLELFEVEDINVQDVDLETVIREMYVANN